MKCPKCGSEEKQHRVGKLPSGSQRYRCYSCGCKYTPEKKPYSYDEEFRKKAVQLYVDGMNLRRIGRHLGVHHQSVANWAKAHAEQLPEAPVPEKWITQRLMNSLRLSVIKKHDLHHHRSRPENALHLRLGRRLGTHPGSHPTNGG